MKNKILYIYEQMPDVYQNYLNLLLGKIKNDLDLKTLTYVYSKESDIVIKSFGLTDKFQRLLFKIGFSKSKSIDIKFMNEFDILHLQHSYLFQKVIPLFKQGKRPKIIITLRGGDTYIKPWFSDSWKEFYQTHGQDIDAFVTMSENQKQYLTRWGINHEKIHVIPISFGTHSSAKPKHPNNEILKLVSAYRMTWEKNIEGTIKFASLLKSKNIKFEYDIYGDGNDLGELYYLVDKYNLSDSIQIKGKIDNNILKSKLNNYDFFIQISISDALPTSVLEAQSVGIPCVVSDSDGLPEAVIDGTTAIVEPYYDIQTMVDRCLDLWKNNDLYYSYSKKAIENANENFSINREIERLTKLYKSL